MLAVFVDIALRNSGIFISHQDSYKFFVVKYKEKFDQTNFLDIKYHKAFWKKLWKTLKSEYKTDKVLAVFESDTFGMRKGGFKTKELLTIVRLNASFSLSEVFTKSEIKFVSSNQWKTKLFKNGGLKKRDYKDKIIEMMKEEAGLQINEKIRHDIIDAMGLFLWAKKENLLI
ncbi:MAG: hypothetical protein QXX30_00235 [Candidatus Aenigmatarchaeota archaeon]